MIYRFSVINHLKRFMAIDHLQSILAIDILLDLLLKLSKAFNMIFTASF